MTSTSSRPVAFLDFDDVLCANAPYGGLHVHHSFIRPREAPEDLYQTLFTAEAVVVLQTLMDEFAPRLVLTTSWLKLLDRDQFEELFRRCGLEVAAASLHEHWAVAADRGLSRHDAIVRWLQQHHEGEPFVVLDDYESGQSLVGSRLDQAGRVVLSEVGKCLQRSQLSGARVALSNPVYLPFL